MCIIAIARKTLDRETVRAMWAQNGDGAGFAWADGGRIHVQKGYMTEETFWAAYSQYDLGQHMVHCRIATAGAVCPELTQPYTCRSDTGYGSGLTYQTVTPVIMHNGHIADWRLMATISGIDPGDNTWNDSRLLARLVAKHGVDILTEFQTKEAIMYPNGRIYYYGAFSKYGDGVLISSTLWTGGRIDRLAYANRPTLPYAYDREAYDEVWARAQRDVTGGEE